MRGVFHLGMLIDSVAKVIYLKECQIKKGAEMVMNASSMLKEQKKRKILYKEQKKELFKKIALVQFGFFLSI